MIIAWRDDFVKGKWYVGILTYRTMIIFLELAYSPASIE